MDLIIKFLRGISKKDLKDFLLPYFIFNAIMVVLACTLCFVLLYFISTVTPFEPVKFYFSFFGNRDNVASIIYLSIFFLVLLSAVSYTNTILSRSVNTNANNLIVNLKEISQKLNTRSNLEGLVCVDFKELIRIEGDFPCQSIYIITNDVDDDINEDHFFGIIKNNLEKGKKYTFLLPNIKSNSTTACILVNQLYKQLSSGKKENIDSIVRVYLVNDQLFRICSLRDIAIYGADTSESKRVGYVEIPYINKAKEHPNERLFIQLNQNICIDVVTEINEIIKNSKLIERVSCSISRVVPGA